jgi:hypothetical protein
MIHMIHQRISPSLLVAVVSSVLLAGPILDQELTGYRTHITMIVDRRMSP